MKQINVGQLISILANVGVIAGIVFLALELQQNNSFLQSDAEYRVMQNRMLFNTELLDDTDSLAAYRKLDMQDDFLEVDPVFYEFLSTNGFILQ